MLFIYVRGGDKTAPHVAQAADWFYGTRHDYPAYTHVYMLDVNWKSYDWGDYVAKVKALTPAMALVPDYERPEQRTTMIQQADEICRLGTLPLVCPKFGGAIQDIPSYAGLAISVPAPSYAGYIPALDELRGWERHVHLLGGNPHRQAETIKTLASIGISVDSIDGSYMSMKAARGQWFDGGKWQPARGIPTTELTIASARKIATYLTNATQWQQGRLI